jgi:hypothetical protein
VNPHGTVEANFQNRFSTNCGVTNDQLNGSLIFEGRPKGAFNAGCLEHELPVLLQDVPLTIRAGMYLQFDAAPPHISRHATQNLNQHISGRRIGHEGPIGHRDHRNSNPLTSVCRGT